MKVGFLSNQLDNRGTGNALYNYAHYNEEILGNKSVIYSYAGARHDSEATRRFTNRFSFNVVYLPQHIDVDILYHIKSGYDDGFRTRGSLPYVVHSVFDNEPHGDKYATISPWMGERFGLPFVPHIVEVADTNTNLREELGIPEDAIVFGRYGGLDSFDISWVWDVIEKILHYHHNVYFVFMNTDKPNINLPDYKVYFLSATVDPVRKRQFINTCDAMIHARGRGETFGIAVGEFAICGKPIITYSESPEKAHLQELGNFALTYNNPDTLYGQLVKVIEGPLVSWGYGQYTPENVMEKFKEVFLS